MFSQISFTVNLKGDNLYTLEELSETKQARLLTCEHRFFLLMERKDWSESRDNGSGLLRGSSLSNPKGPGVYIRLHSDCCRSALPLPFLFHVTEGLGRHSYLLPLLRFVLVVCVTSIP